jgi:O-antigen ligase
MSPYPGREGLMRLLAYAGVFWLGYALGQDHRRAHRLLVLLAVTIAGYAAFGLAKAAGLTAASVPLHGAVFDAVTSTFVNRNSFATYANLGIVLSLALLLAPLAEMGGEVGLRAWAKRAVSLLETRGVLLISLVVTVTASLNTASRGGAVSFAAAACVLLGLVLARARLSRPVLAAAALLAVLSVVTAVALLGGHKVVDRLIAIDSLDQDIDLGGGGRLAGWEVAVNLVAERPLLGHGLGSFASAFDQLRDERFVLGYSKAHNTYLELAVELGLPAATLLCLAVLMLFLLCAHGYVHRRRGLAFPLAGIAATVLVGIHALVDFSLQIPAIAVTYAAILGIACGQTLPASPDPRRRAARE